MLSKVTMKAKSASDPTMTTFARRNSSMGAPRRGLMRALLPQVAERASVTPTGCIVTEIWHGTDQQRSGRSCTARIDADGEVVAYRGAVADADEQSGCRGCRTA